MLPLPRLADLIKDVAPEARDPKVKLAFNLIYPATALDSMSSRENWFDQSLPWISYIQFVQSDCRRLQDKTGKNVSTSLGTVTCARRGPDDDKAQHRLFV